MQTTLITLSLAALGTAQTPNVFSLITTHSGDPNIHLQPVHANGQSFWAGGAVPPSTTYCPDTVQPNCPPPSNTTYLAQGGGFSTASMYVEVPGGQQVFVNSFTGALQFSIPHGSPPAGAISTGFTLTPFGTGLSGFDIPGGAIACPESGSYKIYGEGYYKGDKDACCGVGLVAAPAMDPSVAWEYI